MRGFGLLAANEFLAILFPPLAVLLVRMLFDPIGWQEWNEVSNLICRGRRRYYCRSTVIVTILLDIL